MVAPDTVSRLSWYCVRTQPRREHIAAGNLRERAQVDVFAPRIRVPRRSRSGRPSAVVEALFPGYIFARFDCLHQLRHVMAVSAVTGVVKFGGRFAAVADSVIEVLSSETGRAATESSAPEISPGLWVRVIGGWFRDHEGRVLAFHRGTDRVRVLLSLLDRDVQVSILTQELVPLCNETGSRFESLIPPQTAAAPVAR